MLAALLSCSVYLLRVDLIKLFADGLPVGTAVIVLLHDSQQQLALDFRPRDVRNAGRSEGEKAESAGGSIAGGNQLGNGCPVAQCELLNGAAVSSRVLLHNEQQVVGFVLLPVFPCGWALGLFDQPCEYCLCFCSSHAFYGLARVDLKVFGRLGRSSEDLCKLYLDGVSIGVRIKEGHLISSVYQ